MVPVRQNSVKIEGEYGVNRTERLTLPLFWATINISEWAIVRPMPMDAQLVLVNQEYWRDRRFSTQCFGGR